jgi:hypothetical protein
MSPASHGDRGNRTHDPRTDPVRARFAPAPPGCRSPCACRWRLPPATPACRGPSRSSQQLDHLPQRLGRHLAANAHPRPAAQGDLDRAAAPRSRARLARFWHDRHRQHGDALLRRRRLGPPELRLGSTKPVVDTSVVVAAMPDHRPRRRSASGVPHRALTLLKLTLR